MAACATILYCHQRSGMESVFAQGGTSSMRRCLFMSHLYSLFSLSRTCKMARTRLRSTNIRAYLSGTHRPLPGNRETILIAYSHPELFPCSINPRDKAAEELIIADAMAR